MWYWGICDTKEDDSVESIIKPYLFEPEYTDLELVEMEAASSIPPQAIRQTSVTLVVQL